MTSLSNTQKLSDDDIVKKIVEGEKEQFSLLVDRYADKLGRYIFSLTGYNKQVTDDCLQLTFLTVWKNLKKYKVGSNFNARIYKIAHNASLSLIEKDSHEQYHNYEERDIGFDEEKVDTLETHYRKKILDNMVAKLDKKYRAVILLYHYEEKSYEQIANIMDISINTVGTLLSRAKTKLKKLLIEEEQRFYLSKDMGGKKE